MKALALFLIAVPLCVSAEIYKCETPQGVVFTDKPCDGGSVVEIQDSGGIGLTRAESARVEADLAAHQRRIQAEQYRNSLVARRDSEAAAIDSQIADLRRRQALANNNLAGATYRAGIDQQIAALQQSRAQVVTTYDRQMVNADLIALARDE